MEPHLGPFEPGQNHVRVRLPSNRGDAHAAALLAVSKSVETEASTSDGAGGLELHRSADISTPDDSCQELSV